MQQISDLKNMELLKKHGFCFKKKWGQNFIFDKNLLRRIAKGADISPGESVMEIGPGAGTLTKALLEEGARVLAVEIDESLLPVLNDALRDMDAVVVGGDILKMNLDELVLNNDFQVPYKIVANLPYYITTPIIMNILENEYQYDLLVMMVQWEVAERLTAKPGTKEYGAITLAVNYYTESRVLFKVSRQLFTPVPDVDSAVVCFKQRSVPPVMVKNKKLMFKIIKAGFNQRRKTLANSLLVIEPGITKPQLLVILEKAGINSKRRGETLTLQEYAEVTNIWQKHREANHGCFG